MLTNYGLVGLFLVASLALALIIIILPIILRLLKVIPHKPSKTKQDIYECGLRTTGRTWVQFNFRYYFYALLLIAMDVLVVFLYPWAAEFKSLGLFGFVSALVFVCIILVGYFYAWKKKALEWK